MSIRVMFWNVENFGRNLEGNEPDPEEFSKRVKQVAGHILDINPDLFGLSEIKDKVALRNLLMDKLTDYDFAVTDGAQGIELLASWKRNVFQQVLFTQRREFKAGRSKLRPGSLVSAKIDDNFFNFLFLHTDSGTKSTDYNNRQEMFEKIWSMKDVFDAITEGGEAKFIVMGDLNTMGRQKFGSMPKISGTTEIADLADDAKANGMKLLTKTHNATWRKGPSRPNFQSNLDHAIATPNINFLELSNATSTNPASVSVDGWNHLDGDQRDDFTMNVSDHCSLFCEIS